MSRFYIDTKTTVEDCLSLSVFELNREGLFTSGDMFSFPMTWKLGQREYTIRCSTFCSQYSLTLWHPFNDQSSGNEGLYSYEIKFTTTPCNFGGVRYWFVCPLRPNNQPCERRVGKLYLPPGARYFGCRHCYNLTYESRNETKYKWLKLFRRLERLAKQERKRRKR